MSGEDFFNYLFSDDLIDEKDIRMSKDAVILLLDMYAEFIKHDGCIDQVSVTHPPKENKEEVI